MTPLNYTQCLHYLDTIPIESKEMTTEHIRRLMVYMGNPQNQLQVIHITGTNGKGSTSKMIESILLEANYTTGLFSSPSLISVNEGIQINGQWIDNDTFTQSANTVFNFCKKMVKDGHIHPTTFECLVAIAITVFNECAIDVAIVEVGLGGETDGTNIFTHPLLTIVTSISLDHTEYLGNTTSSITRNKSGIMKKNIPVLIGSMDTDAIDVIQEKASLLNAPIFNTNTMAIQVKSSLDTLSPTQIQTGLENHKKIRPLQQAIELSIKHSDDTLSSLLDDLITAKFQLPLLGPHQSKNAVIALIASNYLSNLGFHITESAIEQGFAKVSWPCRCDYFVTTYHDKPQYIVIDGSHNIDSTKALTQMINKTLPSAKKSSTLILFSALKDKEIQLMLENLGHISDAIICTGIDHPRGEDPDTIGIMAQKAFKKVTVIKTPTLALDYIQSQTNFDLLIITGSLYMTIPLYEAHFKKL